MAFPVNLLDAVEQRRVMLTLTPSEAKRAVSSLAETIGNFDTITEGLAAEALAEGRPAYWTTAGYHNAVVGILVRELNTERSFRLAVAAIAFDFQRKDPRYTAAATLDLLLPLNDAAIADLQQAYRDAMTFRDACELTARTGKYGYRVGRETVAA